MVYDTTAINVSGKSQIYLAIKPQNSTIFSQVVLPLSTIPPTTDTTAPSVPAGLSATTISSSQINLRKWDGGIKPWAVLPPLSVAALDSSAPG